MNIRIFDPLFEDRQDLLGHKRGQITTHYSQAELASLIEAANRVCEEKSRTGRTQAQGRYQLTA